MGVTISRATERKSHPSPGSRGRIPGLGFGGDGGRRESRSREAALLALAGAVVLGAMVLTWGTVSRPLADLQARLGRGEIVNLNAVRSSGEILPLLSFLSTPQERSFVADQIRERLSAGKVDNVGEIGHLRVPGSAIDPHRLPDLAARIQASGRDSATLLSAAQLRQIKPRLVVRTPAQFRSTFLLGAALLFGGFLLAHLALRFRGFRGDQLLLPILLLLCGLGFALMMSLRDPLRDLPLHLRFAVGVLAGCGLFVAGALVDLRADADAAAGGLGARPGGRPLRPPHRPRRGPGRQRRQGQPLRLPAGRADQDPRSRSSSPATSPTAGSSSARSPSGG